MSNADKPLSNFAMMIPNDIARHRDGTPISAFKSDEEKEACRRWILANQVSDEQWQVMSGAEKEKLIQMFKNQKDERR